MDTELLVSQFDTPTSWTRVARLQADITAEQQRIDRMDQAEDAAWDGVAKSINDAIGTYQSAIHDAENEYEAEHY